MVERRVARAIAADLPRKMVLLSGPRQSGKTTLVRALGDARGGRYYSWDAPPDRLAIQKRQLDLERPLWAFDELHKFRRWRAFLKDLSDSVARERQLLVTGSARLEMYGHGGDSLQGRYLPHHLHPLTYSELCGLPFGEVADIPRLATPPPTRELEDLLRCGGFPEPLLAGSDRMAARWRVAYGARLVEEEVASLEQVRELERIELLFDRLGDVAGGVLSINSLREDLEVAFETARNWIAILERLDAVFRLSPYGGPRIKAVKKEQKLPGRLGRPLPRQPPVSGWWHRASPRLPGNVRLAHAAGADADNVRGATSRRRRDRVPTTPDGRRRNMIGHRA